MRTILELSWKGLCESQPRNTTIAGQRSVVSKPTRVGKDVDVPAELGWSVAEVAVAVTTLDLVAVTTFGLPSVCVLVCTAIFEPWKGYPAPEQ
jgi:hypothetical protein